MTQKPAIVDSIVRNNAGRCGVLLESGIAQRSPPAARPALHRTLKNVGISSSHNKNFLIKSKSSLFYQQHDIAERSPPPKSDFYANSSLVFDFFGLAKSTRSTLTKFKFGTKFECFAFRNRLEASARYDGLLFRPPRGKSCR